MEILNPRKVEGDPYVVANFDVRLEPGDLIFPDLLNNWRVKKGKNGALWINSPSYKSYDASWKDTMAFSDIDRKKVFSSELMRLLKPFMESQSKPFMECPF